MSITQKAFTKQEVFTKQKIFAFIMPFLAILLAFIIGGIIILTLGNNPFSAYAALFEGAVGNVAAINTTLIKSTSLIFTALCAVFAYKSGVFNLGGEGQFIMGAIASIAFSVTFTSLPGPVVLIISLLLGTISGALWAAIPGLLKAYRGVNEIIVSILLNYVAALFMSFLYNGPLKSGELPQTNAVIAAARLPKIFPGMRLNWGFFIAIVIAILVQYFLYNTSKGLKLRAVGSNPVASLVNGFGVKKYMLTAFVISGAIAGLGGSVELHGNSYRLMLGFGSGFGFDGVAIALIAGLSPIASVLVAIFFSILRNGANMMQITTGIPTSVASIIQALIIIFAVAGSIITNLPKIREYINSKRRVLNE